MLAWLALEKQNILTPQYDANTPLSQSERAYYLSHFIKWWCYTKRSATTIFSKTQRCNIVPTLLQMVATLFQHCNAVLRKKSWLRIVLCNITLRASCLYAWRHVLADKLDCKLCAAIRDTRRYLRLKGLSRRFLHTCNTIRVSTVWTWFRRKRSFSHHAMSLWCPSSGDFRLI